MLLQIRTLFPCTDQVDMSMLMILKEKSLNNFAVICGLGSHHAMHWAIKAVYIILLLSVYFDCCKICLTIMYMFLTR